MSVRNYSIYHAFHYDTKNEDRFSVEKKKEEIMFILPRRFQPSIHHFQDENVDTSDPNNPNRSVAAEIEGNKCEKSCII